MEKKSPQTFYTITGGSAEVCVCRDKTERWETDMGRAAVVTHPCTQNHTLTGAASAQIIELRDVDCESIRIWKKDLTLNVCMHTFK